MKVRHYRTRKVVEVVSTHPLEWKESRPGSERCIPWLAPSLVDVQVNGFGGVDFNRPNITDEGWRQATDALYAHGCTHFLAAIITHAPEEYVPLAEALEKCRRARPANCVGYHLEGPFLNPQPGYHGAHNPEWMRPADWTLVEKWQKASQGSVRLVTLAPEVEWTASERFMRRASSEGIRLAAGHSSVLGADLLRALELGITGWTHLGNAAPQTMHKFDNILWHALAQNALLATTIPDGRHLPPHVFNVMAKTLDRRLLLTTDAMAAAGASAGHYSIGWLDMELGADGVQRMNGQEKLAGSTLTPFDGVFTAAQMMGGDWQEAWDAFSIRPAAWLGWSHAPAFGSDGNFCLFLTEPQPKLLATYHRGRKVYASPDADACQIFPE